MSVERELDALVAEKVMGFVWNAECSCYQKEEQLIGDFEPSTSIADAWLVVEEIGKQTGYGVEIEYPCGEMGAWQVRFMASVAGEWKGGMGEADTAPEAICRAALEALK